MPPKEPRPASHFRLDLGGQEGVGMFRECSGLDSETTVIEHVSVDENGNPIVRKVPGPTKWSDITLKRGVDESADLWDWRKKVLDEGPDSARTDGFVELLDYSGSPIARWKFLQGWPIKYTGASLDPNSSDVAVEEVVICHEGMEREKPAAMAGSTLRTDVSFTLPRGYRDGEGSVHREGVMRLATARDEIEPLRDPAVRQNDALLAVKLLARVVERIGTVTDIDEELVQDLFAVDFDHLQRLYQRLNADSDTVGVVSCPECGHEFDVDMTEVEDRSLGEA